MRTKKILSSNASISSKNSSSAGAGVDSKRTCVIKGCKFRRNGVAWFRLPSLSIKTKEIRTKWLEILGEENVEIENPKTGKPLKDCRLCFLHFKKTDYTSVKKRSGKMYHHLKDPLNTEPSVAYQQKLPHVTKENFGTCRIEDIPAKFLINQRLFNGVEYESLSPMMCDSEETDSLSDSVEYNLDHLNENMSNTNENISKPNENIPKSNEKMSNVQDVTKDVDASFESPKIDLLFDDIDLDDFWVEKDLFNNNQNIHNTDDVPKKFDITVQTESKFYCLSNDLEKDMMELYDNGNSEFADAVICCQDREFKVHKSVLIARSSVFRSIFGSKLESSLDNLPEIRIEDMRAEPLDEILKFLYTGQLKVDFDHIKDFLNFSEKFNVITIRTFCALELEGRINFEAAFPMLILAVQYNLFDLKQKLLEFIAENISRVLNSEFWKEPMLKRPDLMDMIMQFVKDGSTK